MKPLFMFASLALCALANAQVLITEVSSKTSLPQEDYFELTNLGAAPVDLTGWRFDDESMSWAESVVLNGLGLIAPGESVVVFQPKVTDPANPSYNPVAEEASFRSAWGGLAGVQVGFHLGAGLGKGDAVTIFDSLGNVMALLAYGDGALTDPAGLIPDTHTGTWKGGRDRDAAVWIPGTSPADYTAAKPGLYGGYQNSAGDYGSPGAVPEPATGIAFGAGLVALLRRRRR